MLRDLENIGKPLRKNLVKFFDWPEIEFDREVIEKLETLELISKVNSHSIQINISDNHSIIPSQSIMYAVIAKIFALEVKKYTDVIDELKKIENATQDSVARVLRGSAPLELDLDEYSKRILTGPFANPEKRLEAKDIVNQKKGSSLLKLRANGDFLSSVVLKVLNIPDASSSAVGDLIYHLTEDPDLYSYLEKKFIHRFPFIVKSSEANDIVKRTLLFLDQYDGMKGILRNPQEKAPDILTLESKAGKLSGVFKKSAQLLSANELNTETGPSYFTEPLIMDGDSFLYLSNQWSLSEDPNSRSFETFKTILESEYPEFQIEEKDGNYILKCSAYVDESTQVKGGYNQIFYGAPGTGKSHKIKDIIKNKDFETKTVFHPDLQNSDFFGALKPVVNNGDVDYKFSPGPFAKALLQAYKNPKEKVYLVIEELNRAPAAAVFGDLFLLLDRNPEKGGCSEYEVDIPSEEFGVWLDENNWKHRGKIWLPSNLRILATMNSADQGVYPMDTAFRRRWNQDYLPLQFIKGHKGGPEGDLEIVFAHKNAEPVEWRVFAKALNEYLVDFYHIPEDRLVGQWFLKKDELGERPPGKLLIYLWDDLLRHLDRSKLFDLSVFKTYGELTIQVEKNRPIFSTQFLEKLRSVKSVTGSKIED